MRPVSRSLVLLLLVVLFASGTVVVAAQLGPSPEPGEARVGQVAKEKERRDRKGGDRAEFVSDRVLVGFERGSTRGEREESLDSVDAAAVGQVGATTIAELPSGADVEAAAAELAGDPEVSFAEPDAYRRFDACDACWQLDEGKGVNALAAHAGGAEGDGAVVAVLDTGVATIPDLAGKVAARRACGADGACADDTSGGGSHGTVVASLIAARDDGQGITGVAPGATIKSWKVDGNGTITTSSVLAALGEVARDPDVDVVNLSFSGPMPSTAERLAIESLVGAGKVIVGSAGNDGGYLPQYPSAYRGVLSVGAVDQQGQVASFSSYGKLDVVAPGVCVPASGPSSAGSSVGCPAASRGVVHLSGTSFAAPLVAGTVALRAPGSGLRGRLGLQGTAVRPAGDAVDAKRRGHGLVDAAAWVASFDPKAPPYLVLETTDQLPHPATTIEAFVLTSDGELAAPPPQLTLDPIAATPGAFTEVEAGVFRAATATGTLSAGPLLVTGTAEAPGARKTPPTTATTTPTTAAPPPDTTVVEPGPSESEEPADPTTTTVPPATVPPDPDATAPPAEGDPTTTGAPEPTAPPATTPETTAPPETAPPSTGSAAGAGSAAARSAAAADPPVQVTGTLALRVLRADDQAPGVALFGAGLNPGRRNDSLQGGGTGDPAADDLDDVFRVRMEPGDTLTVRLTPQAGVPIGAALFAPDTTDVMGQLDRIVASVGPLDAAGTAILTYQAPVAGFHLVDVFATGQESGTPGKGTYQLDATLTSADAVRVTTAACSPNGDGVDDACAWSVLDPKATTARSAVFSAAGSVLRQVAGTGDHAWEGDDVTGSPQPDRGDYLLRVVLTNAGGVSGRTLVHEEALTLDRVKPVTSDPAVSPNPFEPVPVDGDRDTTTFAVTSNERALIRVQILDADGSPQRTVFQSGFQNAGRLRVSWNGTAGSATLPRGQYSYVISAVDPAGNRTASARASFTIN